MHLLAELQYGALGFILFSLGTVVVPPNYLSHLCAVKRLSYAPTGRRSRLAKRQLSLTLTLTLTLSPRRLFSSFGLQTRVDHVRAFAESRAPGPGGGDRAPRPPRVGGDNGLHHRHRHCC